MTPVRFKEFVRSLPVSRRHVHNLPLELQPRSVRLGRARLVIETLDEYLGRVERAQCRNPLTHLIDGAP